MPLGTTGGSNAAANPHRDGHQSQRTGRGAGLAGRHTEAHLRARHDRRERRRFAEAAHLQGLSPAGSRHRRDVIRCTRSWRCTTRKAPAARRRRIPFGGQENARAASAAAQAERVRIRVPPNTTLFGMGADATLSRRMARHQPARNRQPRDERDHAQSHLSRHGGLLSGVVAEPTGPSATGTRPMTRYRYAMPHTCGSTTTASRTCALRDCHAAEPTSGGATRCTTASSTSPTNRTTSRCRGINLLITTRPC